MAIKLPVVLYWGTPSELATGDTLLRRLKPSVFGRTRSIDGLEPVFMGV